MDEAIHPLTILAFGMYGPVLPNQNGAPVRLIVPWKYGFKSGKSIVDPIHREAARHLGPGRARGVRLLFNVNPEVDHPRWSQATERRIGEPSSQAKTLMFNGYAEQVGQLYAGLDLEEFLLNRGQPLNCQRSAVKADSPLWQ